MGGILYYCNAVGSRHSAVQPPLPFSSFFSLPDKSLSSSGQVFLSLLDGLPFSSEQAPFFFPAAFLSLPDKPLSSSVQPFFFFHTSLFPLPVKSPFFFRTGLPFSSGWSSSFSLPDSLPFSSEQVPILFRSSLPFSSRRAFPPSPGPENVGIGWSAPFRALCRISESERFVLSCGSVIAFADGESLLRYRIKRGSFVRR